MLALLSSGALQGIAALPVQVEVNTGQRGDPKTFLVGLPDAAVKESYDRVISALQNSGFRTSQTRTTINLAPGNIRKEGPIYDLPIALGILAATGQIQIDNLDAYVIGGELGLSGKTRPIKGALALAILARESGKAGLILPLKSAREAALVDRIPVYGVESLDQAVSFLTGQIHLPSTPSPLPELVQNRNALRDFDFSEIKGQQALRRAVEVAVAGGHNLIMIGPPGSGKSMVAKRIPTIMPEPHLEEFLEILNIHSTAGMTLQSELSTFQRPFRSPHHTISDVGLLGGGSIPGPGEISLAHHGVLFLDELPEFKRSALEVLRQPLEDGIVSISRSAGKITLPCSFMLVAAMNPCPCGHLGNGQIECRCTPTQIQRYRSKISGPLLDRIDIHIDAPAVSMNEIRDSRLGEPSASIVDRISRTRRLQTRRFEKSKASCNARMTHKDMRQYCNLDQSLGDLLQEAMEQLNLSARAYHRVLKVARTVADLDDKPDIEANHLLEAIQYRSLDRRVFY